MNSRSLPGKGKSLPVLFLLTLLNFAVSAQARFSIVSANLLISGTSTLHDWTMKSSKAEGAASFDLSTSGTLSGLDALSFSTPATSLKSEHSSMDDNAYKALKADKNPAISYIMTTATVNAGTTLTCKGKLTIAGVTRDEDLVADCKINADNTITVTGTKQISMRLYDIVPPTFMLGTVKTGNDIVLTFNITLKK